MFPVIECAVARILCASDESRGGGNRCLEIFDRRLRRGPDAAR